jgi:hypothetical protein
MLNVSCAKSLNQFNRMNADLQRKQILMRFVMDGCHFCEESQPDWDSMISTVKKRFKITPNNVITQIDSAFSDDVIRQHNITQNNIPYSVQGYPDYIVIVNGDARPHEKRDKASLISTLLSNKMIVSKQKSKQRKNKRKNKTRVA